MAIYWCSGETPIDLCEGCEYLPCKLAIEESLKSKEVPIQEVVPLVNSPFDGEPLLGEGGEGGSETHPLVVIF